MLEGIAWLLTWLPGCLSTRNVLRKQAMQLNFYGCLRDFQDEAKKKGHPWTLAKVGFWLSREKNILSIIRCLTQVCQSVHSSPWTRYQTRTTCRCGARWNQWALNMLGELTLCRWMVSWGRRATPRTWSSHCPNLSPTFPHTLPWVSVISIQSHSRSMIFRWGRSDPYWHTIWGWASPGGRCDHRGDPRSYGDQVLCSQRKLKSFLPRPSRPKFWEGIQDMLPRVIII